MRSESSLNNLADQYVRNELAIGIVSADSKLHFAKKKDKRRSQHSHWRLLDWLLGTKAGQFLGLCLIAVLLINLGAAAWVTTGGHPDGLYDTSWYQALWFSWGMFFDPGTQMSFGAGDSLKFKFAAVLFSVAGFIYNLTFLGVIVDIVRNALEHWRLRRSRIVANGHTLLLGWSQKSLFLIEQLKRCFESHGEPFHLVILADEDSIHIENEIDPHFPTWSKGRNIAVRSGSPFECNELERVSAVSADAIIVLSSAGSPVLSDRAIVRSIIALAALNQQPLCPIVAEVRTPETSQAIKVIMDTAEGIYARDAVRRVMCLKAAQPAVGDIYEQMMSWSESCEIFLLGLEELHVMDSATIGEAQSRIPRGTVMGVRPEDSLCILAPPQDHKLQPTDHLLVLAESSADLWHHKEGKVEHLKRMLTKKGVGNDCGSKFISTADIRRSNYMSSQRKLVIVIGWPSDVSDLIIAFEDYLPMGSELMFFASPSEKTRRKCLEEDFRTSQKSLNISHRVGNSSNVCALAQLPLEEADAVLVVADEENNDAPAAADSVSLQAAISVEGLLRGSYPNIFVPTGKSKPRLLCEVQSAATERALKSRKGSRNRSLIQYFFSGSLDTGLFTVASTVTPAFNAVLMLLQYNRFGDIMGLPVESFLSEEERLSGNFTKQDLFMRARERGDVLLTVVGPNDRSASLAPSHQLEGPVEPGSLLLVVSRRFFDLSETLGDFTV